MKNIRILIRDESSGLWAEVRKFLGSKGFMDYEDALPQSTSVIPESDPVDTGKFNSTHIPDGFPICTAITGFIRPGMAVIFNFPCEKRPPIFTAIYSQRWCNINFPR